MYGFYKNRTFVSKNFLGSCDDHVSLLWSRGFRLTLFFLTNEIRWKNVQNCVKICKIKFYICVESITKEITDRLVICVYRVNFILLPSHRTQIVRNRPLFKGVIQCSILKCVSFPCLRGEPSKFRTKAAQRTTNGLK